MQQAFDDTSLYQVLGDDFVNVFQVNVAVKCAFGVDDDHRADSAQTETTRLHDLNVI